MKRDEKLGGDKDKRDPSVAEQDGLAEEVGDEAEPQGACQEEQEAHRDRECRGKRDVARRVGLAADDGHRRESPRQRRLRDLRGCSRRRSVRGGADGAAEALLDRGYCRRAESLRDASRTTSP